jgi:hypothetical protein
MYRGRAVNPGYYDGPMSHIKEVFFTVAFGIVAAGDLFV